MPITGLLKHVGMSEQDMALLRTLHESLQPHLQDVASTFIAAIVESIPSLDPSSSERERLLSELVAWMERGLLGPYDEAFSATRAAFIAKMRDCDTPLESMFVVMSVLRLEYQARVLALHPVEQHGHLLRAVHRLFDVELALMAHFHRLASDRLLVSRVSGLHVERLDALSRLTSALAHGLRNPLNSAKLQLELLERRFLKGGDAAELVGHGRIAQGEIARVAQLLADFLAFAQPPPLVLTETDVSGLLRHVHEARRLRAEERNVEMLLDIDDAPVTASVDSTKILRVIENLVDNAIDAVTEGGHVWLDLESSPREIVFSISDDGPGIPRELHLRIYDPFFTTKEAGTGLGMAIVHSFVHLHRGTIALTERNPGSRFEVTVPRE